MFDLFHVFSNNAPFKQQWIRIYKQFAVYDSDSLFHVSPQKNKKSKHLMCIATLHHLHYSGQESKKQFAIYDSDIPVTLR